MSVEEAIAAANEVLPGMPAPEDEVDPRWQAIIEVGEFVAEEPERVWEFVVRWGNHPQDDLRRAIATVLLEHLLECHFATIFPRVEQLTSQDSLFADTFCHCWKLGQSTRPGNSARFDALLSRCGGVSSSAS